MKADTTSYANGKNTWNFNNYQGTGNAVYGLGFIGAVVYYSQQADTFWVFVVGFLKALVWPAFMVYDILKHLAG